MTHEDATEQAIKLLEYLLRGGDANVWWMGKDFNLMDRRAIKRELKKLQRKRSLLEGAKMQGSGQVCPYGTDTAVKSGMAWRP